MGGTDASADAILAGAEDVVRRRRGQGRGAGHLYQSVAKHQRLRPAANFYNLALHDSFAVMFRQTETQKPDSTHAG